MRSSRGFALWIMMVALVVLGVFALLSSRLFAASLRSIHRAQEAHTRQLRFDGMMRILREDVWAAREVRKEGVSLVIAADLPINWQVSADGTVVRRQGGGEIKWQGVGGQSAFTVQNGTVTLIVGEAQIVMPSQIRLAERSAK